MHIYWRLLSGWSFLLMFFMVASVAQASDKHRKLEALADSVVKIYTTAEVFSPFSPWNSATETRIGSGFIIKDKRIFTNAHVVADATFIEVQTDGVPERFEAEVLWVSHEADLALLTVKDKDFFKGRKALTLGGLPGIHQEVTVYGFPTGGNSLSVTKGIVSRIEYQTYAHSDIMFQAIQVDAAINSGNSGGPALSDNKVVGIVMQVAGNGEENIGYMIPMTIVEHFLEDIEDGRYNGFPEFPVETEELVNPALRKKYGLKDDQTGVLVTKVCAATTAEKLIKAGDILTHIDGQRIENNGTVSFLPGKFIDFSYHVDNHQVGDDLILKIIRDGKVQEVSVLLDEGSFTDFTYDEAPRYLVYGGFVFTPRRLYDRCLSREHYDKLEQKKQTEYVRISKVLASSNNIGFHDTTMIVDKVNGQHFNNFLEFYQLVMRGESKFVSLEGANGYQVVIDREVAEQEHEKLLKRYHMKADRSDDLLRFEQRLSSGKPYSQSELGEN